MTVITTDIDRIRRDGGAQPRAQLDEATIADYAEAIAAGAEFPPVDLFNDGEALWLADGYHRVAAHVRAGRHTILALVHQGSRRDAVLFSTGVNAEHGLRRTNADKRRAVEVLLRDAEWGQWSDREIARQTKTSNTFVSDLRQAICQPLTDSIPSAGPEGAGSATRTVNRGGSTYTMNTGNIGQPVKPAAVTTTIRSWLTAVGAHSATAQRNILRQIDLGNPIGVDHLNRLAEYARKAGHVGLLTPDLKRAVAQVSAELAIPEPQPGRVVYTEEPADSVHYTPIWMLEQEIRRYLKRNEQSTPQSQLAMIKGIIAGDPTSQFYRTELEAALHKPFLPGDVKQALNNVRAQMEQAARQPAASIEAAEPPKSAADLAADAVALEPAVWRFIGLRDGCAGATADQLNHGSRITASLLDLEGWHARRGTNFDRLALLGQLANGSLGYRSANGIDHAALDAAIRAVRTPIVQAITAQAAATPTPTDPLITAAYKALGVMKSIASHADEPNEDLVDAIAALEAALNQRS